MEGDETTANLLQCLHHPETALKIVAERAFMKTLDGGCSSPIAVNCELQNEKVPRDNSITLRHDFIAGVAGRSF